jgi:hypothetical protein
MLWAMVWCDAARLSALVVAGAFAFAACGVKADANQGLTPEGTGAFGPGPGCDVDGQHYEEGATVSDDCGACTCTHGELLCPLILCPSDDTGGEGNSGTAGTGASSGKGGNSGNGGSGASGPGGANAGAAGASDADVAACEAAVDAVYAACQVEDPGAPRLCLYEAEKPFCRTGRTAVVKAIFDCLKLDACQTPSDPSEATDCVANVVQTLATADDHAAGAAICACAGSSQSPDCGTNDLAMMLPDAMLLSKSDESAFTTCLGVACDATGCLDASPLGTANSCPGL